MRVAFIKGSTNGSLALALLLAAAGCSSSSNNPPQPDSAVSTGGSGGSGSGGTGGSATGGSGGSTFDAGTGGSLADASPDSSSPPDAAVADASVDGAASSPDGPTGPFALTSSVVKEGGVIDVMYRCTGANVTPPLSWRPGPDGTKSYAVSQVRVNTVHWAIWDIPATTLSLPMGVERAAMPAVPAGSKQAKPGDGGGVDGNSWYGYTGPCPMGANLDYVYAVYALKEPTLPFTPDSKASDVYKYLNDAKNNLGKATLTVKASK